MVAGLNPAEGTKFCACGLARMAEGTGREPVSLAGSSPVTRTILFFWTCHSVIQKVCRYAMAEYSRQRREAGLI